MFNTTKCVNLPVEFVTIRIERDHLERPPHRNAKITDAGLPTESIRITCYSLESHCHSSYSPNGAMHS